jgi:hypothetical protein
MAKALSRVMATLLFVVITPVLLYIALLPMGSGRGTYHAAKALFPWTVISIVVIKDITTPLIVLGIVQYPIYGIIIDWARAKGRFRPAVLTLAAVHFSAALLAFAIAHG